MYNSSIVYSAVYSIIEHYTWYIVFYGNMYGIIPPLTSRSIGHSPEWLRTSLKNKHIHTPGFMSVQRDKYAWCNVGAAPANSAMVVVHICREPERV